MSTFRKTTRSSIMHVVSSLALILLTALSAFATPFTVSGTSDLWLAGMPNGSSASYVDTAPGQSPVLVNGLSIVAGHSLSFSVTGSVNNIASPSGLSPDGGGLITHDSGSENGISNIYAPINSLIGVFLGPNQPNLSAAPAALNFASNLNYASLSPLLQQSFFIGNGLTGSNALQNIIVPDGATRLYLGTMDGYEWSNNYGSFLVSVQDNTPVPEPSTLLLLGAGLAGIGFLRKRSRNS